MFCVFSIYGIIISPAVPTLRVSIFIVSFMPVSTDCFMISPHSYCMCLVDLLGHIITFALLKV